MTVTAEERRFAETYRVARLATADAGAAPHVVPICYALAGDCFYFVVDEKPKRSRLGLKRLRNLAANPKVALLIDNYSDDWTRLAYLLVQGEGAVVIDADEYASTLAALRARYPQYRSMPLAIATHPMVRIRPLHLHLWRAQAPALLR